MGERGPQPGEGGRPPKGIDIEVAKRAAGLGCTTDEIAALFGIGRRTFYDHLEKDQDLKDALEEGRAAGRVTLRRLQWQQAHAGNPAMLIWLGKQLLGQRDRHELSQDPDAPPLTVLHLTAARAVSELAQRVRWPPSPDERGAGVNINGTGHPAIDLVEWEKMPPAIE